MVRQKLALFSHTQRHLSLYVNAFRFNQPALIKPSYLIIAFLKLVRYSCLSYFLSWCAFPLLVSIPSLGQHSLASYAPRGVAPLLTQTQITTPYSLKPRNTRTSPVWELLYRYIAILCTVIIFGVGECVMLLSQISMKKL